MINYPIISELEVNDYGLYPGPKGEGLHVHFRQGLTLILGSNGLGKTTLINMLYRMIAGPWDIPGLASRSELGNADLSPKRIPPSGRQMFANRVADRARDAKASLKFKIGETQISITRNLSDLSIISLKIDHDEWDNDELDYKTELARLVGVWSFGDVILLLRHLVFYFEDRRALVWDASAQRQILRALFLSQATARKWSEWERSILQADSRVRNLSAALYQEEQQLLTNQKKLEASPSIKAELNTLERLQKNDLKKREKIQDELTDADKLRTSLRLRFLKSQQGRDSVFRDLERAKLHAINARFPSHSDTAKYILAQLMTDGECLACENNAPQAAKVLERRIQEGKCVVCGTPLSDTSHDPHKVADTRVKKLIDKLGKADIEMEANQAASDSAESTYNKQVLEFARLDAELANRSQRIDSLIRQMPPGEIDLHQQRDELSTMRARLEKERADLKDERSRFSSFVKSHNRSLVGHSQNVIQAFKDYAQGFLFESCSLTWAPQGAQLGQGGDLIDFPAYELDMTGTDFPSPVRREGPEQVSESQREFIDLAFRMALMETSGGGGSGSLVMDAPESSLDAIFVKRAVVVLGRFAHPRRKNRLIIASNVVEGGLIPALVGITSSPEDQIVNLFDIATPTAAVRENKPEYSRLMRKLLKQSDPN